MTAAEAAKACVDIVNWLPYTLKRRDEVEKTPAKPRPQLGDKPAIYYTKGIWWASLPNWHNGLYLGSETCISHTWRGAMKAVEDYWSGTLAPPNMRHYV